MDALISKALTLLCNGALTGIDEAQIKRLRDSCDRALRETEPVIENQIIEAQHDFYNAFHVWQELPGGFAKLSENIIALEETKTEADKLILLMRRRIAQEESV